MVHVETDVREHAYDTTIVADGKCVDETSTFCSTSLHEVQHCATQTRVYGSDWWRWQIGRNRMKWDSVEIHRAHIGLETTFQTAINIQETAQAVAGLQD